MRLYITLYCIIFSLFIVTKTVCGAEIVIYVEVDEIYKENQWNQPKLIKLFSSENVNPEEQKGTNKWVYQVQIGDKLETPFLIDLAGKVPNKLSFKPLKFNPPFAAIDSTFVIWIAPVKNSGHAREVRKLFRTNIKDSLSDEQLPVFYQQARAVAISRINTLKEEWTELHSYDVQAVFKYLEVVRELTERTYILPPNDIDMAKCWLLKAIDNNSRRVNKAVGLANAKQIITQTDLNESRRFRKLWRYIVNIENSKDKFPLLLSYLYMLKEVPSGERIERVKKETGVYEGTILSSMAQCLSTNIRCHQGISSEKNFSIELMISMLEKSLRITFDAPLKKKLNSDISSLRVLKNDIDKGRPLICHEKVSNNDT